MSAGTASAAGYTSNNPYIQGILWGSRWYTAGSPGQTFITYANNPTYTPNAAETAAYNHVFADISKICKITFVQGTAQTADILLSSGSLAQMQSAYGVNFPANILGIADPPGTYLNGGTGDERSWVFINRSNYSAGGLSKGGYDYIVWLHEIGHALGLAHPHDNGGTSGIFPGVTDPASYGTDNLNQGVFTTMSYNAGWAGQGGAMPAQYGWQATMMAFDVAALQLLYGANMTTATGNDYYILRDTAAAGSYAQCIWDAGGSDVIYYGGNLAVTIDLRPATLTTGYGAGGYISYVSGLAASPSLFTIAKGVTIENAIAGAGNDRIYGNDANNSIYALAGNDYVIAAGGVDYIWADSGNDTVFCGAGNDIVYGGAGFDQIFGESGNDVFVGGAGTDYFYLSRDALSGGFDYVADLMPGQDLILFKAVQQAGMAFYSYAGNAYCLVALATGGTYYFGAAGITPAQLEAATLLY